MENLTTLQKCVNDAQQEHRPLPGSMDPTEPRSFRAHPAVLEKTEAILKNHGVSLSAYVRKCCENLAKDYLDAQG